MNGRGARWLRCALGAVGAVALSGCSWIGQERACTAIGGRTGISVTIKDTADSAAALTLTSCRQGGGCTTVPVDLQPGTAAIDQGCTGNGPDGSCSASMSPTGDLVGFANITELEQGIVSVSARLTRDNTTVALPPVDVAVRRTYPNGKECGADGVHGAVVIDGAALRPATKG